jgi:hypothetical protein
VTHGQGWREFRYRRWRIEWDSGSW